MKKDILEVRLFLSPLARGRPFKGEAEAVSSQNQLGKFDILPQHTNFITLIFDNLTIHTPDKEKISYKFKRGVLEVSDNKVNIFLGV